ncbi:MAG: phage integrase SAM-like domain-containing protein, partial [Bacteroidota bacterium]
MFISKSKKTPFYQLTYEVNGKRTTISTKTTNEKEAQEFLIKFKYSLFEKPQTKTVSILRKETILLSAFQKEYLEFAYPTKSKKYCDSISFSFKQLISFCGDLALGKIDTRILDKFITSTFSRTQKGAHHYYRTLKAAFNKAVEWNYNETNP